MYVKFNFPWISPSWIMMAGMLILFRFIMSSWHFLPDGLRRFIDLLFAVKPTIMSSVHLYQMMCSASADFRKYSSRSDMKISASNEPSVHIAKLSQFFVIWEVIFRRTWVEEFYHVSFNWGVAFCCIGCYIGQTGRSFNTWFKEHHSSSYKTKQQLCRSITANKTWISRTIL